MKKLQAKVKSVYAGEADHTPTTLKVELDGIIGSRHRSYTRKTWKGDKQPPDTVRRNERQWSAVSVEELADISDALDLATPLTADLLKADLCLEGLAELSRLPKGSLLRFPSGTVLMVEEYNPPCLDMGTKIAADYKTRSGEALANTDFSKAAKLTRGIVGVVEAAGTISKDDEVVVEIYETPAWLVRSPD
jgi:hypothetical protein